MPFINRYVIVSDGMSFDEKDNLSDAEVVAQLAVDDCDDNFKLVSIWDQLEKTCVAVVVSDARGHGSYKVSEPLVVSSTI